MLHKLLLCSLALAATLHARIIETDDINEIIRHVYDTHDHHNVLVVFDIDNTIAGCKDGFGGDEWFCALVDNRIQNGSDPNTTLDALLPLFFQVQQRLWMEPMEPYTPYLIQFLQNVGIATVALTARSCPLMDRTFEQLAHINVNFTHTALHPDPIDLTADNTARYRDGIIFAGRHNDKGEILIQFLKTIDYKPDKVIFIDDKMKHVQHVDHAMESMGIACVAIRYARIDARMADYDVADYEGRLQEFYSNYLEPGFLVIS